MFETNHIPTFEINADYSPLAYDAHRRMHHLLMFGKLFGPTGNIGQEMMNIVQSMLISLSVWPAALNRVSHFFGEAAQRTRNLSFSLYVYVYTYHSSDCLRVDSSSEVLIHVHTYMHADIFIYTYLGNTGFRVDPRMSTANAYTCME